MPIRVLHLIGSLRLGGAQVVVKQIAEHLDPAEVETFVYPLRPATIQIPIRGNVIIRNYPNYDPRKFFTIQQLCREHRIDLIHAHLHKPILGALLSTYHLPVPVIVHEHGPISRSGPQYAAYRQMLKILWPRAAAFIAISRHIEEILMDRIGIAKEKIRRFPNAVDFTPFDQWHEDPRGTRSNMNIAEKTLVLGYIGRLSHVKGVDILLEMMRDLIREMPDSLLLIAGDGEEKNALRRQCERLNLQGHVRFLGFASDVRPVMAVSDLAFVPSRQEPFGLAALEWMRMRVPLLTSGTGGLGEIVTHGQTGWLVPDNSPAAYLRNINEIRQDHQQARQVTARSYEQTKAYELTPYLQKLTALYRETLASIGV